MYLTIFGPTTAVGAVGAVTNLGGVKPRQVLEILALAAGAPVAKERLADLLWEGRPPRTGLATLESYVCVLRRSLGGARASGVVTVQQGYRLDPDVWQVDLTACRTLLREAQRTSDPLEQLARVEQALDLASGDLLVESVQASWAGDERDRVRRELAGARVLAAALSLRIGRPEAAVQHARAALATDQHAEGALRTLMQALRETGRRPEALRAFLELRHHLAEDLGVDPAPETTAIYLELLRDSAPVDGAASAREEVRVLIGLLRQAVTGVPGTEVPRTDLGWARLAASLVPA